VNVEHVMQAVTQSMDKESLVKLAEQISKRVTENVIEYLNDTKKTQGDEDGDNKCN
jgi:hypothetical protein